MQELAYFNQVETVANLVTEKPLVAVSVKGFGNRIQNGYTLEVSDSFKETKRGVGERITQPIGSVTNKRLK